MIDSDALIAPISPPLTGASSIDASAFGHARGDSLGGHRRNAAHVDDDSAGLQSGQDAGVAGQHEIDVRRVGQHRDDDGRLPRNVGGRRRRDGARTDKLVDRAAAPVVDDERVPCRDQVLGHRLAHDAKTNKSNSFHANGPLCARLKPSRSIRFERTAPAGV